MKLEDIAKYRFTISERPHRLLVGPISGHDGRLSLSDAIEATV